MRDTDKYKLENKKLDWKDRAEILWNLLDDIDTAGDIFKPNDLKSYKAYEKYVDSRQKQRMLVLESDGYNLFLPKDKL